MSETEVIGEITQVTLTRLRVWVREGWVTPSRSGEGEPGFDDLDLARLRLLCQLKDELEMDDEAIPVILSLLDQVYGLRRELKSLLEAVDRQPEAVRRDLLAAYRRDPHE